MKTEIGILIPLLLIFIGIVAYYWAIVIPELKTKIQFWRNQADSWRHLHEEYMKRKDQRKYSEEQLKRWEGVIRDWQEKFINMEGE
jgi:hypothetical protein